MSSEQSPMSWLWPFGRKRVSDEDAALLKRRCGSRTSALAVCSAANPKQACAAFETDVLMCQCTVLCPAQADAFMACTRAAASALSLEDMPDCSAEVKKMKRALRRYKLPTARA